MILVAGMSVMPAQADPNGIPPLPLILEGSVNLGDEAAVTGTEITAELDGKVIGSTIIGSDGIYGDQPSTKLVVTCEPENYDNIEFYVNGVESDISGVDFSSVNPGDTVSLDMAVSATLVEDTDGSAKSSSSSDSSDNGRVSSLSSSTATAEDKYVNVVNEDENGEYESTLDNVFASPEEAASTTPKDTSGLFSVSGIAVVFLVTLVVMLGVMKVKGSK
ncbi:hypothetical protein [Methanolobus psychrotolerans]|uniref:hypothetical protein n=1 Tax=Methanolobus psychrotolerans TaxID=1874706 RepID=UPI00101AE470|nr:hypothetical protein [Methanolobus psychrotolerans]